jgi:Chaperone of endosialidase
LGANEDSSCYIGNIFGATSVGPGVLINADGKLGIPTSARRFKEEIKPMERASEVLFALKPVTFHYKKAIDPRGISQFGLVAEDVEEVNPDLVVRDKEGKVNCVRYDQVNAMLLNEFLKEHRRVEEQGREMQEQKGTINQLKITAAKQEALIAQSKKDLRAAVVELTARLKEQDSKIDKVSGQVEASRPAPQMVLNEPLKGK